MYADESLDEKHVSLLNFDRELEGFLKISIEIMKRKCSINDSESRDMAEVENDNDTFSKLNSYTDTLYKNSKIELKHHLKSFERFYTRNKRSILKTDISDEWLSNGDFVQFGDGFLALEEKHIRFRINVSAIYMAAVSNKKYTEACILDNEDDKINESDLYRCENFILKLIRIFYHIITITEDRETLEDIIRKYENDLNVPDNRRVAPKYKARNGTGGGPDLVYEMTKRVQSVINDNELPVKMPENIDSLNTEVLLGFADSILQNDQTKNILSTLFNTVKGIDPSVINNLKSNFISDNGTFNMEPIKKITDSLYSGNTSEIQNMASNIGIDLNSNSFKQITDSFNNFDSSSIKLPDL